MADVNDDQKKEDTTKSDDDRPKRGLEDWEMLQAKEEPPLKIPYWVPIIIVGMLLGAVFLSFPLMGVRSGYERPWLDWGLLVGVAYGVISLVIIYFFMRKKKKQLAENSESKDRDQKN